MSPFKSITGRALGKLLEGYKSSDIGKGFGSGSGGADVPVTATGGTKIIDGDYTYHVITSYTPSPEQNFTVLAGNAEVDWLVLGGGGGGSVQHSGGGGAGGLRSSKGPGGPSPSSEATVTIPSGTICPITIGAGGSKATTGPNGGSPDGGPGGFTLWTIPTGSPIRSEGGGGAPSWDTNAGQNGGCGGGGNHGGGGGQANKVSPNTNNAAPNQGYNGGSASSGAHGGAGGGGAGQVGVNGTGSGGSDSNAGDGGNGRQLPAFPTTVLKPAWPSPWHTRIDAITDNAYGGGGGGGSHGNNIRGAGGNGGGGQGNTTSNQGGQSGVDGFGGGGGGSGAYNTSDGGTGGTGLVIIRYLT